LIYFNQNIKDKAKEHLEQALKYAEEINDTSLIEINLFNLGLCATTEEDAAANFVRTADMSRKSGNKSLQSSALEKLAQVYIYSNKFKEAQQSLNQASALCEDNSPQKGEIAVTQCRLWLAEGKYDAALQGYKSLDSLNVYGKLLQANGIFDILVHQGDYKNALAYKDSVHFYTDSIMKLDGTRQVDEIEKAYHANIERKNQRFQILLWSSLSVLTALLLILFFVWKALRLKKRQIELNDKISALNARIADLMTKPDEKEDQKQYNKEDIASISRLIEQKYRLAREVFKGISQYELLKKLNLIREMNADNKAEIKSVYDAIVGRFSGCCSDIRQAFPGLTNDDCVFCTMNFMGCSKEFISHAMGSSEEALRRRKSRIKQKLPEDLFHFFFSK
ncbi:MAG: hypothetical protein K2J82_12825, partial [Muribaculaceae bacterium]|nr:hypothetical protein [Muribaculaceae bacterium]